MTRPRKKTKRSSYLINQIKRDLYSIDWHSPIVMILCALLLVITVGSTIGGCTGAFNRGIRVEIDAAFGGDVTGYAGIVNEADVTQGIVSELKTILEEDRRFEVYTTHEAGENPSIAERAEKIQKDNPTVVISVHADGNPDAELSGMHVYAQVPKDSNHEASLKLADAVAGAFHSDSWKVDTGYLFYRLYEDLNNYEMLFIAEDTPQDELKQYDLDTWEILEKTKVPTIVTNQFYVSNQADVDRWANETGYKEAAQKLYQGLCDFNGLEVMKHD